MAKWACKLCIMTKGLLGSQIDSLPDAEDSEGIARHIESEHHIAVRREDESEEAALKRFRDAYPEAGGPSCKCPSCQVGYSHNGVLEP